MSPPSVYELTTTADTLIHSGAKELPRFWDKRGLWPLGKSGTADNSPASLMAFCDHEIPTDPTCEHVHQLLSHPVETGQQLISCEVRCPMI
jgi:hypothetical protein